MGSHQKYVDCSNFLGRLIPLGATAATLPIIEEAYWLILQQPTTGRWENETPFRGPSSISIDFEKCGAAFTELGETGSDSDTAAVISDTFYTLLHLANGMSPRAAQLDGETRQKLRGFSMGTFLRCASFVALAIRAGVSESHRAELEVMTVEAVKV